MEHPGKVKESESSSQGEELRKPSQELLDHLDFIKTLHSDICLRFSSAEGGHYIRYHSRNQFLAVYSGPHGPENRPTKIGIENIRRLYEQSDVLDYVEISESPYSNLAITKE